MKIRIPAWLLLLLPAGSLVAYDPPKGIPDPATRFGWEIDRATPAFPPEWTAGTPSAVANYYYVDKTHPSATDTGNTYGHPGLPRRSIPEGLLPAGTFVYVHAGTYNATDSSGSSFDWRGPGTSSDPIWISGNPVQRPVIQDLCHIGGPGSASYVVFENFQISDSSAASVRIRPDIDGDTVDHILVRNILRIGTQTAADSVGIGVGLSSNTDTIPNSLISDVVIYNCEIHSVGDKSVSDEAGVYNGFHTRNVWVLDNHVHDVASDSIAGSHYSNYDTRTTENYYIGRNLLHSNGENGIDLKPILGFVISENTIYGPFVRENGWAIVIHYGANTAFHPKNGAVIFNTIYHCSGGIYTGGSSGVDNLDIIGNRIWDIKRTYYGTSNAAENGACIQIDGTTSGANSVFRIVNNTFHDYDRGLLLSPSAGDSFKVYGNIFSSKADATYHEIEVPNTLEPYVDLDYNLYAGANSASFRWQNSTLSLASFRATKGKETNSIAADPRFADPANGDFSLTAGSPAIDVSGIEFPSGDSAYSAFLARWGVDIRIDLQGTARPIDSRWDVGAYESHIPPNAAPSNLLIAP